MPIPESGYVLVLSWYGFTCGNLIPWNIDWATPQASPRRLVAPVLRRCVRVVGRGRDRRPDQREAEVGIRGGAGAGVLRPGHRDLRARRGVLLVDERQRQDGARGVQGGRLVGEADERSLPSCQLDPVP